SRPSPGGALPKATDGPVFRSPRPVEFGLSRGHGREVASAHFKGRRQLPIKIAGHRLPGLESLRKLLASCWSAPAGSIRLGRNSLFLVRLLISCSKRAPSSCANRWSDPSQPA